MSELHQAVHRLPLKWLDALDLILTQRDGDAQRAGLSLKVVASTVIFCGVFYGVFMGSYAWIVGERTFLAQIPMMLYAALKVPLLLCVTTMVSLPSYFVINTLLGLRDDFQAALRAVVSAQAGLTIVLASFSGLILFVYYSLATHETSYRIAILSNAALFGTASLSAQWLLRRYYEPLIAKNRRHLYMMRAWIFVYAFVGIQCGWILRPFIGHPQMEPTFLRVDKLGNAYVVVLEMFWKVIDAAIR